LIERGAEPGDLTITGKKLARKRKIFKVGGFALDTP